MEPEPLEKKKKMGAGGAAKNMGLLYRLLEDKEHEETVNLLQFLSNSKFFASLSAKSLQFFSSD